MNNILAIDCETIPSQSLPAGCLPQFDPSEILHGNAGPDKRREKEDRLRVEFNEKLSKKMSVDPSQCQLCTFVGVLYNTETQSAERELTIQLDAKDKHDDYEVVLEGWEMIRKAWNERIPIVTFGGLHFDLPVMQFRALVKDVPVAPGMYDMLTKKYTNTLHYDIKMLLCTWDKQRMQKKEFYFDLFGLPWEHGFDGSDVWPAYQAGDYDRILKYCHAEVLTLCKLFCRVAPWLTVTTEGG